MTRRGLLALLAMLQAGPLRAEEVPELAPPAGARLPLDIEVRDTAGRARRMGEVLGGLPVVFTFADYHCEALCGTALGLATATLPGTGLRPGEDYNLVVLGLDPRDGPAEATAMRRAWLGEGTALAASARFLVAAAPAVEAAMRALGYRVRRRETGFDHPLALLVLRADGHLAATLPAFGAAPEELRAALRAAGTEAAPGLLARVQLLCQGAGSGRGAALRATLAASGATTFALLSGGIMMLRRRERRG
jgi:protein SCO1/2